jgi:RNA polymerase sigma factor (sigma-70 family)
MEISNELLNDCRLGNRIAQKQLYDKYSALMLGISYRYMQNIEEAEDVLQDSFIKIFKHIVDFKGDGSFEGWCKRILINTALNHIKKNKRINEELEIDKVVGLETESVINIENYDSKIIIGCMNKLPEGYKIILNMYAIEGYSHKEIADELGIAESTSRSQFLRAKASLKKELERLSFEIN